MQWVYRILANITEFGDTPYYTTQELLGRARHFNGAISIVNSRAMQKAALEVFRSIREKWYASECT